MSQIPLERFQIFEHPRAQFRFVLTFANLLRTRGQYSDWAAMLFDFDHDGWLDLLNTNGSAQHEYAQENAIFRDWGDGRFENVSETAGAHFRQKHVERGGTGFEFDNDGRIDLVIVNLNDRRYC